MDPFWSNFEDATRRIMEGSSNAYVPGAWPTMHPQQPPKAATDDPVQETAGHDAQVSSRRTKKANTSRAKLSNFSPQEDTNLCNSWVAISCDPITNIGQKKEAFWVWVAKLYDTNRGPYPERSQRSLMSRWDYIKEQILKFSSYLSYILRVNPSGVSDADKTTEVVARFTAIEPCPFTLMHCWNALKDEPKWMDVMSKGVIGESRPATEHIPQDSNTVDLDETGDQSGGSTGKRPMGRDRAKKDSKKGCSSGPVEYASKFHDLSIEKLSLIRESNEDRRNKMARLLELEEEKNTKLDQHRERQLALEERKVKLMERAEDERILGINLDSCTPALREHYQQLQAQILAKMDN